MARRTMLMPICSSPSDFTFSSVAAQRDNATPPPGTIQLLPRPRRALRARRIFHAGLSFFISGFPVAAPTLITKPRHRPASLNRSLQLPRGQCSRWWSCRSGHEISFTRPSISECLPLPSTMVVLSTLSMVIFLTCAAEIGDLDSSPPA